MELSYLGLGLTFPPFTGCVASGKLCSLSGPQYSHLQNEDNSSTYLTQLLRGLNELLHIKCSKRGLEVSKFNVNIIFIL